MDNSSQNQIPATDSFSEALNHCLDLLIRHNYFTPTYSDKISRQSAVFGQELFLIMMKFRENILTPECKVNQWLPPSQGPQDIGIKIIKTESLDLPLDQLNPAETVDDNEPQDDTIDEPQDTSGDDSEEEKYDEDNEQPGGETTNNIENNQLETLINDGELNLVCKPSRQLIRHSEKLKVVNLARENPTWSVKMLREQSGCSKFVNFAQLADWQKQVKRGGTISEKIMAINGWVYAKVVEAFKKNERVNNDMILELALKAKNAILPNESKFAASSKWIKKFKNNYGIIGPSTNLRIDDQQFNNKKTNGGENVALDLSGNNRDNNKASAMKKSKLTEDSVPESSLLEEKVTGKKKKQLSKTGNSRDKGRAIKNWVFDRCVEAKMKNLEISNNQLKQWAFQAKKDLKIKNLPFSASPGWIHRFKHQYNINVGQDTVDL